MANRNPPGYVSPANRQLTPVAFRLPAETVETLDVAAAALGLSKREFLKQAIAEFAQHAECNERTAGPQPRQRRSRAARFAAE
jgi:Ribbon-helix-helix protein, copG family